MPGELVDNKGKGHAGWSWPAIHPEGRKFALISGLASGVTAFLAWETIAWPLAFLTAGVLAFFRDPQRAVPQSSNLIIAPADGLITLIQKVPPPPELRQPDGSGAGMGEGMLTRVSIFMSVFDVHINRSPIAGRVRRIAYVPGKFVNADLDKASEDNERQHFLVEASDGTKIAFTQIAGLVARRILAFVAEGDSVAAGERIGLIRFGSRLDVFLPAGTGSRLLLGQRAIAGETVVAEIGVDPGLTGSVQ